VAVTYQRAGGQLSIFVDGRLVASQAGFPAPAVPNSPLYLGRSQAGQFWVGQLLYVRISNVVRYSANGPVALGDTPPARLAGSARAFGHRATLDQAQPLVAFSPPPGPFVSDSSSIAIWNLNEGSGTVIDDASGNNYSGIFEAPSGATAWIDSNAFVTPTAAAPTPAATTASRAIVAATSSSRPASIAALPSTGEGGMWRPWPALALLAVTLAVMAAVALRRSLR